MAHLNGYDLLRHPLIAYQLCLLKVLKVNADQNKRSVPVVVAVRSDLSSDGTLNS